MRWGSTHGLCPNLAPLTRPSHTSFSYFAHFSSSAQGKVSVPPREVVCEHMLAVWLSLGTAAADLKSASTARALPGLESCLVDGQMKRVQTQEGNRLIGSRCGLGVGKAAVSPDIHSVSTGRSPLKSHVASTTIIFG